MLTSHHNVLVLPHMTAKLDPSAIAALKSWVEAGGTLISVDGATAQLMAGGLSAVKPLANAIEEAATYDLSLQREWLASQTALANKAAINSYLVPWLADEKSKGSTKIS